MIHQEGKKNLTKKTKFISGIKILDKLTSKSLNENPSIRMLQQWKVRFTEQVQRIMGVKVM